MNSSGPTPPLESRDPFERYWLRLVHGLAGTRRTRRVPQRAETPSLPPLSLADSLILVGFGIALSTYVAGMALALRWLLQLLLGA